jgi:hypothetical protein
MSIHSKSTIMKIYTFLMVLLLSLQVSAQPFVWAKSYDIPNCNEIAALSVDEQGNIFACGIFEAPNTLPYKGKAYLMKTDSGGNTLWNYEVHADLIIGDMAVIDGGALLLGQSVGPVSYRGESFGPSGFFMFAIMTDADGNLLWHFTDAAKYGANTHIAVGNTETLALHIRGQSNLGDWILIIDRQGNVLKQKLLSATHTLVTDIAYYDDRVYVNGGFNGLNPIMIDTILIELPPLENASITMGFDTELTAQWLYTDQTINNRDGRIAADQQGVYVYEEVMTPPFNTLNSLKKFSHAGELLANEEVPVFENSPVLYPDMALTPTRLVLFAKNDFSISSHKIFIFDHSLNLVKEKTISGPSSFYSGQVASMDEEIYVANIFSGTLYFDNELTLPYNGTGNLLYIAQAGVATTIGLHDAVPENQEITIISDPNGQWLEISAHNQFVGCNLYTLNGQLVVAQKLRAQTHRLRLNNLKAGFYILQVESSSGTIVSRKVLVR